MLVNCFPRAYMCFLIYLHFSIKLIIKNKVDAMNLNIKVVLQIPGGVTAAKGFKAAGIYGGLRAQGQKPDLALVTCDVDAASAGCFSFLSALHGINHDIL